MVAYSGLCAGSGAHPSGNRISLRDLLNALQKVRSSGRSKDRQRPHCRPKQPGEHASNAE